MKLKLNPEKSNIRILLLLSLALSSFFVLILVKFLIPDTFIKIGSTKCDSGVIISTKEITYIDTSPIKRKKREKQALEIIVQDKPYKIWLTDISDKKYWRIIESRNNIGLVIKYNYIDRLLHEGILHNPQRIIINETEIIAFDKEKKEAKYALIFILVFSIPTLFFFSLCLWSYWDQLLKKDLNKIRRFVIKK